jgi:hypothetical protein
MVGSPRHWRTSRGGCRWRHRNLAGAVSAVLAAEVKASGWLIEICAAVVCAGLLVFGGCHWQKQRDAAERKQVIGQRDDAYVSLTAAGVELRAVNAQAKANLVAAKASQDAALVAGKVATVAEQAAKQQVAAADKRYQAAVKTPGCANLMATNVEQICALASH